MRPIGLGPFDYTRETYTKSLWISEGITSYYDDLILKRADIYSVAEYLDAFVVNLNYMTSLPGSKFESAEESSFDAWIKHYRPNENTPNVHSSYYTQGAVIGWLLDMEIRRNSSNAKSLDDVMKKVFRETYLKEGRAFTDEEFESAANEVCGKSLTEEIFEARVRGRNAIDFSKYLDYAGLTLRPKYEKDSQKGFLGLKARFESGRTVVSSLLFESPAESSGIAPGDEIIAVDNLRVDNSRFAFYIANRKPDSPVKLLLSRDGSLHKVEAKVGLRPTFEYRIYKGELASAEQKALFECWLGAKWEEDLKYEEYTQSPVRKPIFDYV